MDREQRRHAEELNALGGMRRPFESLLKSPGHQVIGPQIFELANDFLQCNPKIERGILEALENGNDEDQKPDDLELQPFIKTLGTFVKADNTDHSRSLHHQCDTGIRGELLGAWGRMANDVGAHVASWCTIGAPAGIKEQFNLEGVFPPAEDESNEEEPDTLFCDPDSFTNYEGFDDDDEAVAEVVSFERKGYLKGFGDLDELRQYLHAEPVLSRFGCIVKTKDGRTKKRIILDLKQSSVTGVSKKRWRAVLPRMLDFLYEVLDLSCDITAKEELLEFLILDSIDAFWQLPLALLKGLTSSERRVASIMFTCELSRAVGTPHCPGLR